MYPKIIVLFCAFCVLCPVISAVQDLFNRNKRICGDFNEVLEDCHNEVVTTLRDPLRNIQTHTKTKRKCIHIRQDMIQCIDRNYKKCAIERMFDRALFGKESFIEAFCANETNDQMYARHEVCFSHITGLIHKCERKSYKELENDEKRSSHVDECCNKMLIVECVFDEIDDKCHEHTAILAKDAMRHSYFDDHCDQYDKLSDAECSAGTFSIIGIFALISLNYIIAYINYI